AHRSQVFTNREAVSEIQITEADQEVAADAGLRAVAGVKTATAIAAQVVPPQGLGAQQARAGIDTDLPIQEAGQVHELYAVLAGARVNEWSADQSIAERSSVPVISEPEEAPFEPTRLLAVQPSSHPQAQSAAQ